MPAIFFKPRHVPHFRRSPNEPLPNYKALVIGINYMWSPDGLGPGDPDLQLKGPVNDAKDIKKTLKGADVQLKWSLFVASHTFFPKFCCYGALLLSRARYFPYDG